MHGLIFTLYLYLYILYNIINDIVILLHGHAISNKLYFQRCIWNTNDATPPSVSLPRDYVYGDMLVICYLRSRPYTPPRHAPNRRKNSQSPFIFIDT